MRSLTYALATGTQVAPSGSPFPTTLGNVQVSIGGLPAAIYYVSPGQVSAIVPYGVTGPVVEIQVTNNGTALYPAGYPLGTNLVTWTVTDTTGNTNSCQQRVIVLDSVYDQVLDGLVSAVRSLRIGPPGVGAPSLQAPPSRTATLESPATYTVRWFRGECGST